MRPLIIIGGYLTSPADFAGLAAALAQPPYGYRIFTVPIGRLRWALTRDYDFRPVVSRLRETVQQALQVTGAEKVTLLSYSVGGVAARIYLGDVPYLGEVYGGWRHVERLVTLGTPHTSLERWTLKLYQFVDASYPGAYHNDVRYISVVGHALQGNPRGRMAERWARESYMLVGGTERGCEWGDGVTTLTAAFLPGAEFLAVPGLYHSTFHGKPWYGDPAGLPLWGRVMR